jgi:hypothetical protein
MFNYNHAFFVCSWYLLDFVDISVLYFVAFLFENDLSNPDGINNNKVSISDIEKLSGFKFK